MEKNNKKTILFIIFLILLAVVVGGTVFLILERTTPNPINTSSSAYIGILEDGTYYIPKAKSNITFEVDKNEANYILLNEDEKSVESSIITKNDKNYIKSEKKYEEGKTYTIELLDGNFTNETLKEARKIKFKIEEKEKAIYNLSDNVDVVENNKIELQDENKIKVEGKNLKTGEIIVVEDKNNNMANVYKIENIENGLATTSTPEISEIYKDFVLYEDSKVDFTKIKINDEFKDEIEMAVKESPIYQFLVNEVQADDIEPVVKITPTKDNLEIDVSITAKAKGVPFLGIKALSDHDLVIKFKITLGAQFIADIEKGKEFNFDMAMTQNIETNVSLSTENDILKGIENIPDSEYIKSIQDITDRLENAESDSTEGHLKVAGLELPTNIPFTNVYMDVYLQNAFSVNLKMNYNQTLSLEEHVGIIMNSNETTPYFNYSNPQTTQDMEVLGKAELRVGAGLDVGISVINKNVANVGIGEELGVYADIFATAKMNIINVEDIKANFEGKIEAGLYMKCKIEANINVLFLKKSYKKDIIDKKAPLIKIEKTINYENGDINKETAINIGPNNNKTNQSTNQSAYNGTMQSISINSGNSITNAYKEYIKEKKYVNDFKEFGQSTLKNVGYTIFDINQDGIPELIIEAMGDVEEVWRFDLIYTYYNNAVLKLDNIYNYGGIRYNKTDKEIVYAEVRPTSYTGGYEFYKLENNQFTISKSVGHDGGYQDENGNTVKMSYFCIYANGDRINLTQEQESDYYKNVESFQYSDITKVY